MRNKKGRSRQAKSRSRLETHRPKCSQKALEQRANFDDAMKPNLEHEPRVLWLRWQDENKTLETAK